MVKKGHVYLSVCHMKWSARCLRNSFNFVNCNKGTKKHTHTPTQIIYTIEGAFVTVKTNERAIKSKMVSNFQQPRNCQMSSVIYRDKIYTVKDITKVAKRIASKIIFLFYFFSIFRITKSRQEQKSFLSW